MPISRRTFLVGGASALVLAACSGDDDDTTAPTDAPSDEVEVPTTRPPDVPLSADPFTLGIASGDPDATSVVLWTRLTGAEGEHDVLWEVLDGERLVAAGVATASAAAGHAVHAVVDDLEPGRAYEYRFTAGDFTSPVGTTRTAPDGDAERLRFAFASCQDWQDGYYAAHEHLAAEDIDLVVFLGDYIYEGGISDSAVRPHDGPEVTTLDAYRARYALYRSDPNLRAAHARAPWFVVWDDHEVDNDHAGRVAEADAPDVDFVARRTAAYRAWWEHMPTRLPPPDGDALPIHRALRWGSLATFFGLDGRQYRDDQPCDSEGDLSPGCAERDDPARTMLGAEQEAWLADELPASRSTWNVLAQQTIFSPSGIQAGPTELFNLDQWDGYPAARERLIDTLVETSNPVVITGDIHASAIAEVKRGEQVVAVELVGTSLSSSFPPDLVDLYDAAATAAGAKMSDAGHRGYVVCEVTPATFRADYRVVESVFEASSPVSTSSSWEITAGTPGISPA